MTDLFLTAGPGWVLRHAPDTRPAAPPSAWWRDDPVGYSSAGWWRAVRVCRVGASSSVGQSTRLISVGSEVQVLPGPPCFRAAKAWSPGGIGKRAAARRCCSAVSSWRRPLCPSGSDLVRGLSSVGRAPALQAGGQRFEPASLHCMACVAFWVGCPVLSR